MPNNLPGKTVAILATDGVEQVELIKPKKALEDAGAKTEVVSPAEKKLKGWNMKNGEKRFRSTSRSGRQIPQSTTRCSCRVG